MEGVPEDMWSPFKQLYGALKVVLNDGKDADGSSGVGTINFKSTLQRRKSNFMNFLRNPPRNERNRAQLLKIGKDAVDSRNFYISKDLLDEAIILSDIFDLDEFHALDMLITAQRQMAQHAGLPRGLIAVLLYYDGRKALSCILRDLCDNTAGVSWSPELPEELITIISSFTQKLVDESNILGRLIELLEGQLNIDKEFELLTMNRAFGPKKHQNQIRRLIEDIRLAIATSLFNWSAQRGLPKQIVLRLYQYLCKYKTSTTNSSSSTISNGSRIDNVGVTLLMALVYSFDTSILQSQEDNNVFVKRLPILSEADFANEIFGKLVAHPVGHDQAQAKKNRYECFVKFCFGLSLTNLKHAPPNLQIGVRTVIDRDKFLVDAAIAMGVFDFMFNDLLENELIFINEFFYRRVHLAITDFIDFMQPKVVELHRTHDDSSFALLMLCIGKLYKENPSNLSLCDEYWCLLEANITRNIGYQTITPRSGTLYKFIRMVGKSLTQKHFVPYINMLIGLSSSEKSARKVFNLLQQAQSTLIAAPISSTLLVSWDRFFQTLRTYYANSHVNSNNRSRLQQNLAISPPDISSLQAILSLIGIVAYHYDISRLVFSQNQNWSAIELLMSLLRSSEVPISLKAEILFTLSAMAKSVESATLIWTSLEHSQIIKTVPSMTINLNDNADLDTDIEKYECRNEEYPVSRGILALLYTLVTTHIPVNLGIGSRKPGIDPYVKFVENGMFLKFYNRIYIKETEKWEVGASCLKVLHHLLELYDPKPQDFMEQQYSNSPAGYHLMLQLNSKSYMIHMILLLIEDACKIIDDFSNFPGKEHVENCGLYSLLILEQVLFKQMDFYDAQSKSKNSVQLVGINRLLLDKNPRTRQTDHLLNIMKFVTFNNWLPRHALASINILYIIFGFPNVSEQILAICDGQRNASLKLEIRQGFVECLDEIVSSNNSTTTTRISENAKIIEPIIPIRQQIKDVILKLMLRCIKQPMPNFGYFLLGYQIHREVNSAHNNQLLRSVIETGVNCMMTMIVRMEKYSNKKNIAASSNNYSGDYITERCWYLIYNLCVYNRTSETTLHYLRNSCNDFLLRHMAALPSPPSAPPHPRQLPYKQEHKTCSIHELEKMSHVMKCVTIELKLAATRKQISRFSKISDILVGGIESPSSSLASFNLRLEYINYLLQMQMQPNGGLHYSPPSFLMDHRGQHEAIANMHISILFDYVSLEENKEKSLPKLDFFDEMKLSEILSSCKEHNLINIKALSGILHDKLSTVQTTIASGQRQYIIHEIRMILMYAVEMNSGLRQCSATNKFMEAWSQLTQILFTCVPDPAAMPLILRAKYIIYIVQQLLMKIIPNQMRSEIALLGSETIMLLMAHLRYCFYKLEDESLKNDNENNTTSDQQSSTDLGLMVKTSLRTNKSTIAHLRFILKNVIDWIMLSAVDRSKATQKLRINLYTVFVYCLSIVKRSRKTYGSADYEDGSFSLLDRSKAEGASEHSNYFGDLNDLKSSGLSMVIAVLKTFGNKLINLLCDDVVNGQDVCRLTAFSCMDLILEINPEPHTIIFIRSSGYLGEIIKSLRDSNEALINILEEVPDSLKELYIYESKMAFLLRYASTHIGAETLLTETFLVVLSDMKVFDMRPEMKKPEDLKKKNNNFIPDVDERYRSILFPALGTLDCILTTLGYENQLVCTQIKSFLFAHSDMIESILRTATPYRNSLGILKELSSVTNIIARTVSRDIGYSDDYFLEDNTKAAMVVTPNVGYSDKKKSLTIYKDREIENRFWRFNQLMLSLYERFVINKTTFEKMLNTEEVAYDPTEENKNLHMKYFLEIATNVALYCYNVITFRRGNSTFQQFNFDVPLMNGITSERKKLTGVVNNVLNQLKGSVDLYHKHKSELDYLNLEIASLSDNLLNAQAKIQELNKSYNNKRDLQELVIPLIEKTMYLLWINLHYYLRRAVIINVEGASVVNENYNANNETPIPFSHEEMLSLKQTLIATFNETFCNKLFATSEYVTVCNSFSSIMVRRIKSLVQFSMPVQES